MDHLTTCLLCVAAAVLPPDRADADAAAALADAQARIVLRTAQARVTAGSREPAAVVRPGRLEWPPPRRLPTVFCPT